MTAIVSFEGRPPAQAVAYLEDKVVGGRFSFDWRDVDREEHLTAMVVAKAMTADLLADFKGGLLTAINEGQGGAKFAREITPILQAKGWWGKALQTDPKTGVQQLVQLGSPARLRTIFDVNMRMAHAAGRWERFTRSAATRPFLTYHHTRQERPRPEHVVWDGITLPIGHVFWSTHYCPNGWGCKCFITSERAGAAVTSQAELERIGVGETTTYRNKRTGEVRQVPVGIDPGFEYNVGEARMANFIPPPVPERQRQVVQGERLPRALPAAPRPRGLPSGVRLREDLGGSDPQTVFEAFSKVLGTGEGGVFVDRAQVPLVIGRRIFERHTAEGVSTGAKDHLVGRAAYAEILAQALKDPDEIWHSVQQRADGTSVLVRNYVAWIKAGDGREVFVAGFHAREGLWWGTTAYPPGKRKKQIDQRAQTDAAFRVGALVYRRKE